MKEVEKLHIEILKDTTAITESKRYGKQYLWPLKPNAISAFTAKKKKRTTSHTDNICEDCVNFGYIELSGNTFPFDNDSVHRLMIESKGRHFLMKLGFLREWSKDNQEWLNPGIAFIVGILAAGITLIIYFLSRNS